MTFSSTLPPILLVEDDPSVSETLSAMLCHFGFEIVTAPSFQAAKRYIELNSICGLITDETLGDGSGMALAAFALERDPFLLVGVISGADTTTPQALEGRVKFLAKPFSGDELRRFVSGFPRKSRPA